MLSGWDMWLINTLTKTLEEFNETTVPPYAILSHTWGQEEVTFTDMRTPHASSTTTKRGYEKITFMCDKTWLQDLKYAWIDTCCIDKSSSAELSEAINSMFNLYAKAQVCLVLLTDVPGSRLQLLVDSDAFSKSRWFTRGWTLQELLAPRKVEFYNAAHEFFGTLQDRLEVVHEATGIDLPVLRMERKLADVSVAKRMSWAAKRETTRVEDRAYSLLGIFQINMPMLYGEGRKAFQRLQEEILRNSVDHSIFAWEVGSSKEYTTRILAPSPRFFRNANNVVSFNTGNRHRGYRMTNSGLEITLPIIRPWNDRFDQGLALLECGYETDLSTILALQLQMAWSEDGDHGRDSEALQCSMLPDYYISRIYGGEDTRLVIVDALLREGTAKVRPLLISHEPAQWVASSCSFWIRHADRRLDRYLDEAQVVGLAGTWDAVAHTLKFEGSRTGTAAVHFDCGAARIMIAMGVQKSRQGVAPNMISISIWDRAPDAEEIRTRFWTDQLENEESPFVNVRESFDFKGSWFLSRRQDECLTMTSQMRELRGGSVVEIMLDCDMRSTVVPIFATNWDHVQYLSTTFMHRSERRVWPSAAELAAAQGFARHDGEDLTELACDLREKMLASEEPPSQMAVGIDSSEDPSTWSQTLSSESRDVPLDLPSLLAIADIIFADANETGAQPIATDQIRRFMPSEEEIARAKLIWKSRQGSVADNGADSGKNDAADGGLNGVSDVAVKNLAFALREKMSSEPKHGELGHVLTENQAERVPVYDTQRMVNGGGEHSAREEPYNPEEGVTAH